MLRWRIVLRLAVGHSSRVEANLDGPLASYAGMVIGEEFWAMESYFFLLTCFWNGKWDLLRVGVFVGYTVILSILYFQAILEYVLTYTNGEWHSMMTPELCGHSAPRAEIKGTPKFGERPTKQWCTSDYAPIKKSSHNECSANTFVVPKR